MRDEKDITSHSTPDEQAYYQLVCRTHDTLYSRQSALPLSYQGSSAGWAQISHLIVHPMNRLTINLYVVTQFLYIVNILLVIGDAGNTVVGKFLLRQEYVCVCE